MKVTYGILMFLLIIGLFLPVTQAFAANEMTLSGTIIDNACGTAHKADLATFIGTHEKSCATAPACAATGYMIYANGKAYEFDKASSKKVEAFLAKAENTLNVTVTAREKGKELELVSIENRM